MRVREPGPLRPVQKVSAPTNGASRVRSVILVLLVLTGLPAVTQSCAFLYSRPQVRILNVEVRNLGFTSGSLDVVVEVTNPNRFGVELRSMRYRLELEDPQIDDGWLSLASGEANERVSVPGREMQEVSLNLPFQYGSIGSLLRIVLDGDDLQYRVRGDLTARGPLGNMDFPFESRGTFEL